MDVAHIRNMLRINKHRLDDELELQAQIAEEISAQVATRNARVAAAAEKLKLREADLYLELRSGEKLTSDELQAKVRRDRERRSLAQALDQEKYDQDVWIGLQEAWRQRSYALSTLSHLYSADYFDATKTSLRDSSTSRRSGYDPSPGRQAIREASASRGGRVRIGD